MILKFAQRYNVTESYEENCDVMPYDRPDIMPHDFRTLISGAKHDTTPEGPRLYGLKKTSSIVDHICEKHDSDRNKVYITRIRK